MPESSVRTGGRFDLVGALGMAVGLVSLLLAVSKGADWGWGSGTTLGLLALAVVVLVAWGFFELRTAAPLVDLRTTVLGRSMLTVGLVMAPQGLVMMAMAPVSALITRAWGPKITLMIGAVIVAAVYGLDIVMMSEVWQLILASCVIGAGVGFAYGAMPALIMGAVPPSETAAANSLNTLMRSIGTSVASAVAGVVLAQLTISLGGHALPSENGFRVVMAIGAGAALLAFGGDGRLRSAGAGAPGTGLCGQARAARGGVGIRRVSTLGPPDTTPVLSQR